MNTKHKLGKYIKIIDIRNKNLAVSRLLGVSINKTFIESIANTVGTDFSNYKIVCHGQFAYCPVTSRNGDKISVALLKEKECIISNAYTVFEITDNKKLLPEYLMLWFMRPEFDRYARFKSHGSVREIFDWQQMCDVELPVPDIEKQQKIIDIYKIITERIDLKKRINKNLEEQAQAIFKSWFVDFEPFGNIMPEDWRIGILSEIAEIQSGKRPPLKQTEKTETANIQIVGATSVMGFTNNYNHNEKILVIGRVGTHGIIQRFNCPCWTSDNTLVIKTDYYEYVYQLLKQIDYSILNRGSTQPLITQGDMNKVNIIIPDLQILIKYENNITALMNKHENNIKENQHLSALRDFLIPELINK
ncbi:MAG: restriction endonuclease subunit S [Ruminococcus flavefaciens]|nr:restriction endonuclease subunit S [Ruminococcus flavefaciens]